MRVHYAGRVYDGWKSVRIDAGIEQMARAFALEVTYSLPGDLSFRDFQSGGLAQVYIDDDLVCTGWITSTPASYDANSIRLQLQGKSRTVDLVDCCPVSAAFAAAGSTGTQWADVKGKTSTATTSATSTPQTSWKGMAAADIIMALAQPYGIAVTVQGDSGSATDHTVNPGETVAASIERLIEKTNLMATDDERGNLVLAQPGAAGEADDALILGQNILRGSAQFDASKRYSRYVVLGQCAGTDDVFGASAAELQGSADDSGVARFRLKVLKDEGESSFAGCAGRADFECRYRAGNFQRASYTVQGWRQSSGKLWRPNLQVYVKDAVLGLDRWMVITKVSLSLSAQGMTTQLEVVPPDALLSEQTTSTSSTSSSTWAGVK
ncbi:phage baseplate assembly protein [Sutterella sp.]|uniref:phage baseplate assembly protein n=1 Tax=Sutterella sp. TaxID=1981025 RepID=UPI0026DEA2CA|nr:hypothetical protein [Sutterella sp.]MDO5531428.1 hypothetical protein [Sutterella sp.]